ncbi:MAG TPA: hypothetical protein VGP72_32430 [Planctomycetota bacterium]
MLLLELIDFIEDYRRCHPRADKVKLAEVTASKFALRCKRSVFSNDKVAVRFSSAQETGFSNTVLSLSALRQYDSIPFLVCVVRPGRVDFLLANATFLTKISHSSQALRVNNIRGSFNGSDIMREYEGIKNTPAEFERLLSIHQDFAWEENLQRLVEKTTAIAPTGRRFAPTVEQRELILIAPALAAKVLRRPEYKKIKNELADLVRQNTSKILSIAALENVNMRGNQIEQVITGARNAHRLGDMQRLFSDGTTIEIEIKTKLRDRSSAPKAYNIDKLLETLALGKTVPVFGFIGIEVSAKRVTFQTASFFDQSILAATQIQTHWAGRSSRGVTQLTGSFSQVFEPSFQEHIDVSGSVAFLEKLLAR